MTAKELNRDIKRLSNAILAMKDKPAEVYFPFVDGYAKTEFKRLYYADTKMEFMNLNSVKIMFRLNLSHRFIALHQFGINIELDTL